MRKIITFTVASLLMAGAFAAGEVYRWKGPDGIWHYSDQPRPGAELVRRDGSYARSQTGTEPESVRAAATPIASQPQSAPPADESLPVSPEVAAEVRAKAEANRAEQCKQAEANYQDALTKRRFYRTDEKGNRVYLTEAEADAYRLQARAARDLACGAGN
jgi:hypothetical protein